MSTIFSDCGNYRYRLTRQGNLVAAKPAAVFIMLNPSTADAETDDRTIRRCRQFATRWGCNGLIVVNLYARRSTYPKRLWERGIDPVGAENDRHLVEAVTGAGEVVCAWGANARQDRVDQVVAILTAAGAQLKCLGVTKLGAPRHPLHILASQQLIDWPVRGGDT